MKYKKNDSWSDVEKKLKKEKIFLYSLLAIRGIALLVALAVVFSIFFYNWTHPELTTMQVFKKFVTFDF